MYAVICIGLIGEPGKFQCVCPFCFCCSLDADALWTLTTSGAIHLSSCDNVPVVRGRFFAAKLMAVLPTFSGAMAPVQSIHSSAVNLFYRHTGTSCTICMHFVISCTPCVRFLDSTLGPGHDYWVRQALQQRERFWQCPQTMLLAINI